MNISGQIAEQLPRGALIIGEVERRALHELRALAAARPIHMPDLVATLGTEAGRAAHRERMTRQSCGIPTRYIVSFSIETGHPMGTARHMSMSSLADGRLPTQEAVWMVAEELGFIGSLAECRIWLEDLSGGGKGVNVAQPVGVSGVGHG